MSYVENDWVLLPHSSYLRDLRWYAKKRPAELSAVLRNLERTMTLLANRPNTGSGRTFWRAHLITGQMRPNTGSGRYSLGADTKREDKVRIWYQAGLVTA